MGAPTPAPGADDEVGQHAGISPAAPPLPAARTFRMDRYSRGAATRASF